MAGKNNPGSFDPTIDDFGFDDFNPSSPDIDSRKQTPTRRALKGVGEGIKETVLSKAMLMRLVRASAPTGVRRTIDTIDEAASIGSDLYNSVSQQVLPELVSLKRNARRLMPRVKEYLPNRLTKTLDDLLKDNSPQSGPDYNPDEETIKGAMRDVFEAERLLQQHYRDEDKAEEMLRNRVTDDRERGTARHIKALRALAEQDAIRQDTVAVRRDQKMLELGYRQYFSQRDLLIETKRANVDVLDQLKAMVSNTSLPDLAKLKEYNRTNGNKGGGIRGRIDDHVSNFRAKLTDRLTREAKRLGMSARMGLNGLNQMASAASMASSLPPGMGPDGYGTAGQIAGSIGTDMLASSDYATALGNRLGRMVRKIPGVARANEKLNYWQDNGAELASEWAKKRSNGIRWDFWRKRDPFDFSQGFGADSINKLKSLVPKFYEGTSEFSSTGYGKNKEPVSYDDLSRKSLVEIIPGLLSRILGEVNGIRTGSDPDRQHYDHASGGFVGTSEFQQSLRNQLIPKHQNDQLRRNVDDLMKKLTRGGKLTDEAKAALRKQLIHNMVLGRRFNAENLAKGRGLDLIEDPTILRELTAHFRKLFPLNETGELDDSTGNVRRLNRFSNSYQDIRRMIPKFDDSITSMLDAGGREQLRAIGALKRDGKREFLDPAFIVNALTGQGEPNGDNEEKDKSKAPPKDGNGSNRRRRNKRRNRGGAPGNGPTPDSPGDIPPSPGDQVEDILSRLTDITSRLSGGRIDELIDSSQRLTGAVRDRLNPTEDPMPADEAEVMDSTDDIYVPGEDEPRLTRQGFAAGRYICKTTRKVIKKLSDIQGPIVDSTGRVLVGTGEIAKGLVTGAGVRLAQLSKRAERWVNRIDFASRLIGTRLNNTYDKFKQGMVGLRGRIDDVYVLGMPDPVLTAEKMRQGAYVNRYSKKPINTIDDIKGAVEDREGNVVLTDEDYDKGMYLKDGTLVRRSGLIYNLGRFTNAYFGGYYRNLWKLMKKTGRGVKKVAGVATRIALGVPDVYTVDDLETPKLQARLLRRGMYLSSKTGRRITRLGQIDSDVLGPDGNIALTMEDIERGLCNKFGEPLKALLPRALNKALSIAGAPTRMMGKLWTKSMRGMGRATATTLRAGTDAAGWVFDKVTGLRKGSWEERRFKREEAERNRRDPNAAPSDNEKKKNPLWGPILMLAGVLKGGVDKLVSKLNPLRYLKDILTASRAGRLAGDLLGGGRRGLGRGLGRAAGAVGRGLGGLATRAAATGLGTAAVSAGGAVLSGAGTALTMLGAGAAAVGSAALAVLTSPITLTAAAVAAAGFGAWWLWKKYGSSPDPIQAVRLAEYGIASGDRDTNAKVLKLEESVADYTVVRAGTASFTKELPLKEIFDMFNVDTNSNENIIAFTNWLKYRFRPVFLKFAAKGDEILPGTKVHQQDDKIPDGDKPLLVRETKFSSESADYPYNSADGPNPPAPAVTGTEAIDAAIERVVRKFSKDERKKQAADTAKQRTADNAKAMEGGKNPLADAAKANAPGNRYTTQSKLDKVASDTIQKHGDVGAALWEAGSMRKIDELAGIRLRTYGLVDLDKARVDALLLLETDLEAQIQYKGDGTATLDYNPIKLYELYGPRFQLNITDWKQRSRWMTWFNDRFVPAYLAFATAVRKSDKAVAPREAWSKLKAEDQLKVAQAVIAATTTSWFSKVSVWTITDSPWVDYVLNQDSSTTTEALDSLRAKIKQAKLEETRKTQNSPKVGDGLPGYVKAKDAKDQPLANNINAALANSGVGALNGIPSMPQKSDGTGGPASTGEYSGGNAVDITDGAGGQYGSLPESKGNGWDNNKDLLAAVSKMTGVDVTTLATFAAIESNFRPNVKAGTSSATGLFQFIDSTWKEMLRKYGAKYGIPPNTPSSDARANALMGAEFLRENRDGLAKSLSREPTDVDLYAAHFLGLGGARKFMSMNGNTIAAQAMPEQARANEGIFYTNGRALTRDEVMDKLSNLVQSKGRKYGAAAAAFASGASGVTDIDSVAQDVPSGDDNVVGVAGGDVQSKAAQDSGAPPPSDPGKGGYMGSPAPTTAAPSVDLPTSPDADLSPVAQQALNTPAAQTRAAAQTTARAPAAPLVTNAELADVLGKQLQTQVEIRDLVNKMLELAHSRAADSSTDTASSGNDKSTNIARQQTATGPTRGPISLRRNM